MNPPLISVIVPIYNVEEYIGACLNSLCAQTLKDIEIICVDDCGNDGSMEITRKYASRDARIRILKHDKNRGLSAARNTGIREAHAPYIMFCDSDDWYEADMCAKMHSAIDAKNDVDLAICSIHVHYEEHPELEKDDSEYFRHKFKGIVTMQPFVAQKCDECAWNKIYRRSLIEEHQLSFPEGLKHEDLFFFNFYIIHTRKVHFIEDKLYHYRRRKGSIMSVILSGQSFDALDKIHIGCRLWEYFHQPEHGDRWGNYGDWVWKICISSIAYGADKKRLLCKAADILHHFIQQLGYTEEKELPPSIIEGLLILCHIWSLKSRRLLGVVREKSTFLSRKTSLLGIKIINEQYHFDKITRNHLFSKSHVQMDASVFHPFHISHTSLVDELKKLGVFTYIPNPGNMGDALLAAATLRFFEENELPYHMLGDKDECADVIVYGGGGIWIEQYEQDWEKLLPIFKQAKKVLILPSSFNNCPRLIESLDERFVIFCREVPSYEYLKSVESQATIQLDHDMALRMPESFLPTIIGTLPVSHQAEELMNLYSRLPDREIGYLLRSDAESAGLAHAKSVDLSACVNFTSQVTREELYHYAGLMLCAVDYFRTIVTDRLHVGIAAALMGKEVYLLDNSYKKVSSVYQHSLQSMNNIHLVNHMPKEIPHSHTPSPNDCLHDTLCQRMISMRKKRSEVALAHLKKLCTAQ